HSPWIAQGAYEVGLTSAQDTAEGLHAAMVRVLAGAMREQKLTLIRAHPDLAGRLKLKDLTADSQSEQASAGLDSLTPADRDRFLALNDAYRARFGFPFIMAVKGRSRDEILQAFEDRLDHEYEQEFDTAMAQIERIALLRLKERLPSSVDAFSNIA
ncbi:MAG: 2-oxo-4-hydroxy-4-carboxy-5-ureidoimidazoline decarboxylase, partial [Pseudomonadota bacterium]|nr:2-oxo-4-hydroxy-4-carboxy-5-ureidoimidazoline decarboxylase [Pseudomonadota bacterium]